MTLGLPSYGYVQESTSERLRTRWHSYVDRHHWHDHEDSERHHDHDMNEGQHRHENSEGWRGSQHDSDNNDTDFDDSSPEVVHNGQPGPSGSQPLKVLSSDGQVQFRELVRQGALTIASDGATQYIASGGFERRWDPCSETAFLRSVASGQIVTYDDPMSLALKAKFAKEAGLLGVNIFDIHGDTDEMHLADAIRAAMGQVNEARWRNISLCVAQGRVCCSNFPRNHVPHHLSHFYQTAWLFLPLHS